MDTIIISLNYLQGFLLHMILEKYIGSFDNNEDSESNNPFVDAVKSIHGQFTEIPIYEAIAAEYGDDGHCRVCIDEERRMELVFSDFEIKCLAIILGFEIDRLNNNTHDDPIQDETAIMIEVLESIRALIPCELIESIEILTVNFLQ